MRVSVRSLLPFFAVLAVLACLAGCSNHAPAIVPIGNKTVETGFTLEVEVRAVDDDGDALEFGIEGMPAGAEFHDDLEGYALFVWTPIASDAGPDGRGKDYPITFKVSDGSAAASETIIVTVTLGGAGTGAPIFVTPSDHTLDLDRSDQVRFNVEVRDPDSASVDLRIEDNPPGGTFETAPGSKLASYRWRPTEAQIAEKPVWGVRVSADDHVNPPVVQDITILLKGGTQNCAGTPPDIAHDELPDQRSADDYIIEAVATDAESAIDSVGLYYFVDLGDGSPAEYTKSTMTAIGGDAYQQVIPNPGLTGDATAKVSYYLCAEDSDEGGSGCSHRTCLPKEGRFSFTAYAPGNQQCENDPFEPNDGVGAATALEEGSYADCKICPEDEDWYAVQLPAGHWLGAGIFYTRANGQLEIDLFAADGSTLLQSGVQDGDMAALFSDVAGQQRSLLLRVRGAAGVENTYDLVLISCRPDQYEPNDQPADATPVADGEYVQLTCCGEPDWYRLDLEAGDGLDVLLEFDNAAGDLDLWLFEPAALEGEVLGCEQALACSTTADDDESISVAAVPADSTYYIAVGPYQGARNDYTMTVAVTPGQQGCSDDDNEPDDTPAAATDIWDDGPRTGLQICAGDVDWFGTIGYAGEVLAFDLRFTHADGDLDMALYADGVTEDTLGEYRLAVADSTDDDEHLEYTVQSDAIFYLRVYGYDGAENSYSLEMTLP